MGNIERDHCEICGVECNIERTYIHFDYKCECHSPNHFILIRHCKDHKPLIKIENEQLFADRDQYAIQMYDKYMKAITAGEFTGSFAKFILTQTEKGA